MLIQRVYPEIINLPSTQCDVNPVCIPRDYQSASTQCDVDPECVPRDYQPASTQCDVDPVCILIELLSTCLNHVQCGSSVGPHRAVVYLPQASMMLIQCVYPEIINLPQLSVMLIQYVWVPDVNPVWVPIELLSTCLKPV